MAKGSQSSSEMKEREELAYKAKQNLVSQYLHLGTAMKRCSAAVEAFAAVINDSTSIEEVRSLLSAPASGSMPGIPSELPLLTANGSKKRAKSDDSDDEAALPEGAKKKRGPAKQKKEKDPNAPKRPMSAYLMFQNAARHEFKEKHPDLPYKELIAQIGEAWKSLDEAAQKPYKLAADAAMATWRDDSAAYVGQKGVADAEDAEVEQAILSKEGKKEKKVKDDKKAGKEKKADKAGEKDKKPSKKDAAAAAAAAKAPASATTSTPAAKNAAAPKAPTSTKKNQPAPVAPSESSSGSEEESSSEEESDD